MNKTLILLVGLFVLVFIGACTQATEKTENNVLITPEENSREKPMIDLSAYNDFRALRFALPSMDREMCETYPRLIIEALENTEGVIDASFNYEGHIATIIYVPELISKKELLNDETYSWIGTVELTDKEETRANAKERLAQRENNNKLIMPEEHMLEGYIDIPPEVLNAMLKEKDFTLVDVHIPEQNHILGTDDIIPFDDIEALEAALPDKEAKIVLYCRSGRMSSESSAELARRGYTNIYNLEGGIKAWTAEGYAVEAIS